MLVDTSIITRTLQPQHELYPLVDRALEHGMPDNVVRAVTENEERLSSRVRDSKKNKLLDH